MAESAMFMFNVHFEGRDDKEFSQIVKVAAFTPERASELARARLRELGDCTITDERVELVSDWIRSEGVKRVAERFCGMNIRTEYLPPLPPLPHWEPTETIDQRKVCKTLWPIVECLVNRDLARLPKVCTLYEGATPENYFEEVYLYPAKLILPPDDRWETLVHEEDPIPIRDTSPQKWGLWGKLHTQEEGESDLVYMVDVWDEGRDVYEAFLINVTVP